MDQRLLPITSKSRIDEAVDKINRQSRVYEWELQGFPSAGLNEWRKPVTEYGFNDSYWETLIKTSSDFKHMDFSNEEWKMSRETTDEILNMIFTDIKAFADDFKGLKIERYVRHGSSREGLKVIAADEFDTILLYDFEGFNLTPVQVSMNNSINPEFCFLEVPQTLTWLKANYSRLCDAGVFEEDKDGAVKLNARALHQQVFESIIDRSVTNTIAKIEEAVKRKVVPFRIRKKMIPSSINITIEIEIHQPTVRRIDLNILPGILIKTDRPFYAVMKSLEEFMQWRSFTSVHEIKIFDLASADQRIRYIMTALRLVKSYCTITKQRALADGNVGSSFTTVLRFYALKHIAFYLILYLIYIHDVDVKGVSEVLTYFSAFLKISLEKKLLPHFFHSNGMITKMFSEFPAHPPTPRCNLFENQSSEVLREAMLSVNTHLLPALHFNLPTDEAKQKVNMVTNDYEDKLSQE